MKKLLLLLYVMYGQISFAQLSHQKKMQFDSLLYDYAETKQFSGVVLVAKGDKILYQKAVGYAHKEGKVPNEVSTNFNIASTGKTFTAVMTMQLVQEGKIDLKQSVKSLLPEYAIKKADSITVEHLLTHTSGVGNYMTHPDYEKERFNLKSLDAVMPFVVAQEPTLNFVGERYDYSNSGFIILGRIIEKLTGKSYNENLETRIFKPLGIKNSYIHYPATFNAPKEATPYFTYTARTFINGAAEEFPGYSDGGMQSNVGDLYRYAKGLLIGKILDPKLRDSMWNSKVPSGGKGKYAYGWIDNNNEFGKKIYSHDGGGKGFAADLRIVKDDDYVIVVLINNRVNPREVSGNILSILYKGTYQKPVKLLENVLLEKMEEKGFDYVKGNYAAILKEKGFDKTPNPWVYIMFGDMLENLKEYNKALLVYEMGRNEFPKEASVYDVTGQLYLTTGKLTEAEKWFNKALEIDANDEFARMMLSNIKKKLK
jgi:CubicO group peptidase (beta-lactamase class C family)